MLALTRTMASSLFKRSSCAGAAARGGMLANSMLLRSPAASPAAGQLRLQQHLRHLSAAAASSSTAAAAGGAKKGDFVQVHYTGTLDDGAVFDSSRPRGSPLEFVVGGGKVIVGFDQAVTGLRVGESRKSRIAPADAYGEVDPNLQIKFPRSKAPEGLEQGMQVQLSNGMVARVASVDDEQVVLDLNHELAGKALTFDVELVGHTPLERMQKATFGAGCFWGVELAFQRVPGVLSTEVGYSNGTVFNPTYEDVCTGRTGHVEVVQVTYDPDQVGYEKLLEVFFDKHDPTQVNRQGADEGTQFRSAIFFHSPEQQEAAMKMKEKLQAKYEQPIATAVEGVFMYHTAEDYHQQFLARGGRSGKPQNPSKGCTDTIRCYG